MKNKYLIPAMFLIICAVSFSQASKEKNLDRKPAKAEVSPIEIIYVKKADVQYCQKNSLGCAPKIEIDSITYLIDDSLSAVKLDKSKDGGISSHELVGFIVSEKGHFPNPTADFAVFKLISITQ